MISFEEALEIVLEKAGPLLKVRLPLDRLSGKCLAETILAPFPLPRFDNSSVDGYAIRTGDYRIASEETPASLTVHQTIHAGNVAVATLPSGQAVRIMTGAPIPPETDAVVMREEVETEDGLYLRRTVKPGENIRFRGAELQESVPVLTQNTRITPPVIGMLATLGLPDALAYASPRVTVIITGDELKSPGEVVSGAQIYYSNGPAISSSLAVIGVETIRLRHVFDREDLFREAMQIALTNSDIVITVGGVSVGDHDFVRTVSERLGVRELIWRVAIKPGKPFYFGLNEATDGRGTLVFGLPGNPVAALVTLAVFVEPAIRKMMGDSNPVQATHSARLETTLSKAEARLEFVRGIYFEADGVWRVVAVKGQESHMLSGLAAANCLIMFPRDETQILAGATVNVIPLSRSA